MESDRFVEQLPATGILFNDLLFIDAIVEEIRTNKRQSNVL